MRIARIFIFASILGVATTVAVAWGLAAWLPQRNWSKEEITNQDRESNQAFVKITEHRARGATRRNWSREHPWSLSFWSAFSYSIDRDDEGPYLNFRFVPLEGSWGRAKAVLHDPTPPADVQDGCEHATGWPMLAAWYGLSATYSGNAMKIAVDAGIPIEGVAHFPVSGDASVIRALPLHPIWRGIIVDSLIYAAAWSTMFIGIGTIRRALRRRAGRCARCAYDLSGLRSGTLCPECGAARGAHPTPRSERDPA